MGQALVHRCRRVIPCVVMLGPDPSIQSRCRWRSAPCHPGLPGPARQRQLDQASVSLHQHTDWVGRLFAMEFAAAAAVHLSDRRAELDSWGGRESMGSARAAMPPEIAKTSRPRYGPGAASPARSRGSPARNGAKVCDRVVHGLGRAGCRPYMRPTMFCSHARYGMFGGSGGPLGSEDEPPPR